MIGGEAPERARVLEMVSMKGEDCGHAADVPCCTAGLDG